MKNILITALLLMVNVAMCSAADTDYSGLSAVEKVEVYQFRLSPGLQLKMIF